METIVTALAVSQGTEIHSHVQNVRIGVINIQDNRMDYISLKDIMIGYKAISHFTFDDCVHHIEYSKQNGFNPDADVEKLFSSLLNEFQLKDDALFKENKTSLHGCRKYIKSFPFAGAKSYEAKHLDEAKQIVSKLEKRNKIGCFCIVGVLFVIFAIWGMLTFKPNPNLSMQDEIEVSQYGDTILLSNYLQGTDNETEIYIEDSPEIEVDSISLGYNVYRNDRHDYYDLGQSQSSDYMDLSWEKIFIFIESI